MGILDSLNGDQDRQRLQLLEEQYKAIGQQLLTEQNPVMRPLLEMQQEQIEAKIREIEAKTGAQTGAKPLPVKRRLVGADALPAVMVWHGRDRLLADLAREFEADRRNVIALLGQGGMGKSALAAKLVEAAGIDVRSGKFAETCGFDCAIAFKAFEGSSFDEVAGVLLAGLGLQEEGLDARGTIAAIVRGLGQVRALVVLDNLESVLLPPSGARPGRAVSLEWGDLLNGLAVGNHRSLVMLTSREFPADLSDRRLPNAKPNRALVRVEPIEQVDVTSAIEILQEYGMQDSPEDLAWIARQVDGHPIYLQLLAANYGEMPGFLRKNPQELAGGLDGELAKQWLRQSEAARDLARRLCVLRVPIDAKGLTFLRLYKEADYQAAQQEFKEFESHLIQLLEDDKEDEVKALLDEYNILEEKAKIPIEITTVETVSETLQILNALVCGSLVQKQYDGSKCADEFSMHRVIVEFLERELGEARSGLLGSVYQFYRSGRSVKNPKTLEDLQPLLEAQFFAFQLGNYGEAESLIYKLEKYLDPWGYWLLWKDLCEQILPKLDIADQRFMWQRIGIIHKKWGDWNKAKHSFSEALKIAQKLKQKSGIAAALGLLGDIERYRGNWDEAERLYRQSLELRTELGDRSGMAMTWGSLGDIERNRGNWDEAERLIQKSLQMMVELGDRSSTAMLIGSLGENELDRGNLKKAEEFLTEALHKLKELGVLNKVAECNFRLAQLWQRRNNPDRAQHHYTIAHDLYTQLGAAKELERIQQEFTPNER
jgi:tetratricopeptide (TPR) repeat protein